MLRAVLDSTILVSAFLAPKGLTAQLLSQAQRGAFTLYLSEQILAETQEVLIERKHIRQRYSHTDEQAIRFCRSLRLGVHLASDLPTVTGVVRDPDDDHVIACALAAHASYLVTRDPDLLTLDTYREVKIITPEAFMGILREQG
jgi:putative PIN family toxin of toxin-antitoxin system